MRLPRYNTVYRPQCVADDRGYGNPERGADGGVRGDRKRRLGCTHVTYVGTYIYIYIYYVHRRIIYDSERADRRGMWMSVVNLHV